MRIPVLAATLLIGGCGLSGTKFILVRPGDPVWLVEDITGVRVLGRGEDGKMLPGRADLKAGAVVWYDKKWSVEDGRLRNRDDQ
jgi:hypothetical protein